MNEHKTIKTKQVEKQAEALGIERIVPETSKLISKEELDKMRKDIDSIEKRLKNNTLLVEANADYINDFKAKLEATVNSVVEMVSNNKSAMDVIFSCLRWHQVSLFIITPLLIGVIIALVKHVCR